jgi:uncharacterized OB-fold protein
MGRQTGVRKCKDCGSMHLPGRAHCEEFKCLPNGCPGCQTYGSLNVKQLRAKFGIKVRATCQKCGVVYYWMNPKVRELEGVL